jgi:isocitrate dehydrogenase kinase/phosphatase
MRSGLAGFNHDTAKAADALAQRILRAFGSYHEAFHAITRRAPSRFEHGDWRGAQQDAADRLTLYRERVRETLRAATAILTSLPPGVEARRVWEAAKSTYADGSASHDEPEVAETFFNSVARRAQGTVGADPETTFVTSSVRPRAGDGAALYTTLPGCEIDADLFDRMLSLFNWSVPYADRSGDAARAAAIAGPDLKQRCGGSPIDGIDVLRSPFYRNKGAYLVARVRTGRRAMPLILALVREPGGIVVDAVLPTPDEASIVFGFSWTYFCVDVQEPAALVRFLSSVMPLKRTDELYTAIGYNRHGKTVFFRDLMQHLDEHPDVHFAFAEGDEGTVMSVFALPSFNIVFKVIKDRFTFPKTTTRRAVRERYQFVFVRDRVGRLADAQEFEKLELPVVCFDTALLEHLLTTCSETVRVVGDRVLLQHAYTERRVTPLNLYLKSAKADDARRAVLDYGQAIKDLAGSNIFTGDMLRKNFGVTRHGRVICYDYDELALLTDCQIRPLPQPVHEEDEWSAEPSFFVGESDVFPEEFGAFLIPPGDLGPLFLAAHGDLLRVDYWREMQRRVRAGELVDSFPYQAHRRLRG